MRTGSPGCRRAPHATTVASVGPYVFHTSRSAVAKRSPISGGHASPPRISSRTASRADGGHMSTRVGTVDTTLTSLATSHGARSAPLRTSERGAGTRHAPCPHASHISSQEASKATDRPAITRSPGPSGASWQNSTDSASTNAAAERCVTATPFGVPVEPDVKMIQASSSSRGGSTAPDPRTSSRRRRTTRPSVTTASAWASRSTVVARSGGSSTSIGT